MSFVYSFQKKKKKQMGQRGNQIHHNQFYDFSRKRRKNNREKIKKVEPENIPLVVSE